MLLTATNCGEILDSHLVYAADGGTRPYCGGAPYRQLCPAYPLANYVAPVGRIRSPLDRAKGSARTFQRGKFPDSTRVPITSRKRVSQTLPSLLTQIRETTAHSKPGLTRGT